MRNVQDMVAYATPKEGFKAAEVHVSSTLGDKKPAAMD